MKKVMLVASLGAVLMLGACSSNEESESSISSNTNTESVAVENTTVSESQESSGTPTGWVEGDYDTYTKTIAEQVILDNDMMKITLTGNLEADEDDVNIEYILENKTDSAISCFLDDTEMDGAMIEIKGVGEANANTKVKDEFSLERESLFEDDLNKLSTIKSAVYIELGNDFLNEKPIVEFSLN